MPEILRKRLIFFLIIQDLISIGQSLKCFRCGEDGKAGDLSCDEFNETGNLRENEKFIQNCLEESHSCFYQEYDLNVIRGCGEEYAVAGCGNVNGIKYCYCDTDLCNSNMTIFESPITESLQVNSNVTIFESPITESQVKDTFVNLIFGIEDDEDYRFGGSGDSGFREQSGEIGIQEYREEITDKFEDENLEEFSSTTTGTEGQVKSETIEKVTITSPNENSTEPLFVEVSDNPNEDEFLEEEVSEPVTKFEDNTKTLVLSSIEKNLSCRNSIRKDIFLVSVFISILLRIVRK